MIAIARTIETLSNGAVFAQDDGVVKFGTDAVLLADFARPDKDARVIDLGTGTGVIPVLLLARGGIRRADGLELDPRAAALANENARLNGFADRMAVYAADLRDVRHSALPAGGYDYVAANPPYRKTASGKLAADAARAMARSELACTLADVMSAARYLLTFGGKAAFVYLPERLAELTRAMEDANIMPKRVRFVHTRPDKPAALVMAEGKHGGKPGLTVQPPLFLHDMDRRETEELRRIYRYSQTT